MVWLSPGSTFTTLMGTFGSAPAPEPCTAVHVEPPSACALVLLKRWPTLSGMGIVFCVHAVLVRVAFELTQTVLPVVSLGSNAMLLGCTQFPEASGYTLTVSSQVAPPFEVTYALERLTVPYAPTTLGFAAAFISCSGKALVMVVQPARELAQLIVPLIELQLRAPLVVR